MAKRPAWLTRNVLAVGVVSLLTDASSEMILPFLPLFVASLPGGVAGTLCCDAAKDGYSPLANSAGDSPLRRVSNPIR